MAHQALQKSSEIPSGLVSPRSKTKKSSIKSKDVINRTGGVTTEDGRTLFGMDAETYLRLKAKEDPELERKTGEWIEDVLGRAIEDPTDLWKSLKDGIVLCELLNKIQPGAVKRIAQPKNGKPLHVLQERENINQYLEACYKLGMSRDALFVTSDLHGRQGMSSVLQNLSALSQKVKYMQATKEGGSGITVAPIAPSKSLAEAKSKGVKWSVATDYLTPIMTGDLEDGDDIQAKFADAQAELKTAKLTIKKLEGSNASLKSDLATYRDRLRKLETSSAEPTGESTSEHLSSDPSIASLMDEIVALKAAATEQEEKNKKFYLIIKKDKKQLKELADIRNALMDQIETLKTGGQSPKSPKGAPEEFNKLLEKIRFLEDENKGLKAEISLHVGKIHEHEDFERETREKFQKEKSNMEATIATLEADIESLLAQVEAAPVVDPAKIEKLEEEKRSLEVQKKTLEQEQKVMNADIDELLKDIDTQQATHAARLKEEQDKFRALEAEKQSLESQKRELMEEKRKLLLSIEEWETKLSSLQLKLKETEREHAVALKEAIDAERAKMSHKSLENTNLLESQLLSLKNQLKEAQKAAESAKEESAKVQQLIGSNERLEHEVAHLQKENQALEKNINAIITQKEGALHDRDVQTSLRLQQLESEKELLNTQRVNLEKLNVSLKNQVSGLETNFESLNKQIARLKESNKEEVNALKAELSMLREKHNKAESQISALEQSQRSYQREIQQTKSESVETANRLQVEITKLQTEKETLQNRTNELTEENTAVQRSQSTVQQELASALAKIGRLEEQDHAKQRRYETEKKRTDNELQKTQKEMEWIQQQKTKLESQKQKLETDLEDLKNQHKKMNVTTQSQIKELKASHQSDEQQNQSRIYSLSARNAQLEEEIKQLKSVRDQLLIQPPTETITTTIVEDGETYEFIQQPKTPTRVVRDLVDELKKAKRGSSQALKKMTSEYATLQREFIRMKQELMRHMDREDELEQQVNFLSDTNMQLKEMLKPKNPLLQLLTDLMEMLLDVTKKPQEEDVVKVKGVFKLDEGRRLFTSILEKAIVTAQGAKELSTNNFELLLFLINTCLNELKLENGADYICAKILLTTAESLYRKVKMKSGVKDECVMPYIKDHYVWEHLSFWEEYFWDVMAKSFQDAFGSTSDYTEIHKQFIQTKLAEFGRSMEGWGRLKSEDIDKFCRKIIEELQKSDEEVESEGEESVADVGGSDSSWGSSSEDDDLLNESGNGSDWSD